MFKILKVIRKNLIFAIPITMILAIVYGNTFDPKPLKQYIIILTFFMVYPMMVNLNYNELMSIGNTKLHLTTQFVNFFVIPIVGYGLGIIFFKSNVYLLTGLLLMSLLPTSGMTISWTGFANGNVPAAIKMMIIGLLLGSFLAPLYLKLLLGEAINITFMSIFSSIIKVVFIPMLAGFVTQRFLIYKYGEDRFIKDIKIRFPLLATVGLIGIVFVSTSLKAKTIVKNPQMLLLIFGALIIYYLINFVISHFIGLRLYTKRNSISLVYGTVMRNLSIALAIAITALGSKGSDAALIIAVAFIIQIQGAAWYLKLLDRLKQ